jgi:hypothetical protein
MNTGYVYVMVLYYYYMDVIIFQGNHTDCHESSPCRRQNYSPSKVTLREQAAIDAYEKALKQTQIYRYAESYCRCRDTFWVESFNHQLLMYLPKRIHFGTSTFNMRMNLAVLDWNENVQRAATSERLYWDIRRPDRRTPMKVLVEKTFAFTQYLWTTYLQRNKPVLGPIDEEPVAIETDEEDVYWDDGDTLSESEDDNEEF